MPDDTPFVGEPANSREAIMRATHRALHEYGYAGLSIQRIADEAELSKSTFYHHYDDKDDLLVSFIGYVIQEFVRIFSLEAGEDPRENLRTFIDFVLADSPDIGREITANIDDILGTYVELRAQGVRDETVRTQFTEADTVFSEQVTNMIQTGVDDGVFVPADADATGAFIVTVIAGNIFQRTTQEHYSPDTVRDELDWYIEHRLEP